MTEPHPFDPIWPRYSQRTFPTYRFVPGRHPHPRHSPKGHSYGQQERKPTLLAPNEWSQSDDYLYGIDLYNYAYWWECHEVFEGLWNIAGHRSEQGNFFQALIQLTAARLKRLMGNEEAAQTLMKNSSGRLVGVPDFYMGLDVMELRTSLHASLMSDHPHQLLLKLK